MNLTEMKMKDFMDRLASSAPAPGGGSASALLGSLGTALIAMVAHLTAGKKKYEAYEDRMQNVLEETADLLENLMNLMERDTEVYETVGDALAMPRETKEEKEKRQSALQQALKEATIVPFAIMEESARGLKILEKCLGYSNPNAVSDLGVAATSLKASIQGAWLNVLINLGSITDQDFVTEYREKGEWLLEEVLERADQMYQQVVRQL